MAVAHPCDEVSLRGVVEATNLRLMEPILVGPVERVRAVAAQIEHRHQCDRDREFRA